MPDKFRSAKAQTGTLKKPGCLTNQKPSTDACRHVIPTTAKDIREGMPYRVDSTDFANSGDI